jgi:hypothetical protein
MITQSKPRRRMTVADFLRWAMTVTVAELLPELG